MLSGWRVVIFSQSTGDRNAVGNDPRCSEGLAEPVLQDALA
jgi:hypothetical protein